MIIRILSIFIEKCIINVVVIVKFIKREDTRTK